MSDMKWNNIPFIFDASQHLTLSLEFQSFNGLDIECSPVFQFCLLTEMLSKMTNIRFDVSVIRYQYKTMMNALYAFIQKKKNFFGLINLSIGFLSLSMKFTKIHVFSIIVQ